MINILGSSISIILMTVSNKVKAHISLNNEIDFGVSHTKL